MRIATELQEDATESSEPNGNLVIYQHWSGSNIIFKNLIHEHFSIIWTANNCDTQLSMLITKIYIFISSVRNQWFN